MTSKLPLIYVFALGLGLWNGAVMAAPLPVVASFSILGDMVKQVGGDAVAVTVLVGPDADTHTYEPTPGDAVSIQQAKIVFTNGLGFEGWITRMVSPDAYHGTLVVASTGVKSATMTDDDDKDAGKHDAGGQPKVVTDPHAWQDLSNGRLYVHNIAVALEQALPAQADAIKQRAAAYDAQLAAMDQDAKAKIGAVPPAQRKIITSHDAFGYFGRAYGVEFLAPVGLSTDAEPSAADLARLDQQIKAEGVKLVFLENMSNSRLIEQIARDTHAKVGGTLYADALSPPGQGADTYLGMFTHNVPLLVSAMQQTAK